MNNTIVTVTNDPTVTITGDAPTVAAIAPVTVQPTYDFNNLTNKPTLGTAAALDVGTMANNILELDSNAKVPAVDGSQLTMLPARNLNCGRLVYVSPTQISFVPFKGALVQINGQLYTIPPSGVSASNAGLSAGTRYYVYINLYAGSLVLTISLSGHATSSTLYNYGIEIATGNDAYSLVGMIRTNASAQFVDSLTQRFVASWFNQRPRAVAKATGGQYSTAGTAFSELGAGAQRAEFISWASTSTMLQYSQSIDLADNTISGQITDMMLGIDGAGVGCVAIGYNGSVGNNYMTFAGNWCDELAEGYHHFEMFWCVGVAGYTTTNISSGYGTLTATVFI